jgi:hypothetical protein
MPLELGLTITWAALYPRKHTWFVWESSPFRIQKSMSDVNGTDPNIHYGTVEGVLSELRNAFVFKDAPPVPQMLDAYVLLESKVGRILASAGTANLYSATVFKQLCLAALDAVGIAAKKNWP